METDANGLVQVDVRDVAAETIYIVARDGETDKAAAMVIAEAGQQALVFA